MCSFLYIPLKTFVPLLRNVILNIMARRKDKTLNIRVSDSFITLLKELADKKGMSQANLIEYLVRKEADSMQLKERFEQEQVKEGEE